MLQPRSWSERSSRGLASSSTSNYNVSIVVTIAIVWWHWCIILGADSTSEPRLFHWCNIFWCGQNINWCDLIFFCQIRIILNKIKVNSDGQFFILINRNLSISKYCHIRIKGSHPSRAVGIGYELNFHVPFIKCSHYLWHFKASSKNSKQCKPSTSMAPHYTLTALHHCSQ